MAGLRLFTFLESPHYRHILFTSAFCKYLLTDITIQCFIMVLGRVNPWEKIQAFSHYENNAWVYWFQEMLTDYL